jgi:hypothetical protein
VPGPGAGVCTICRGPALASRRICFACRVVARRLGLPLSPVLPARLCPLPSPLYTVLLGYKESPVAEARRRFGVLVRALTSSFLGARRADVTALLGGPVDVVSVVPSTHRSGVAPLARVDGLARAVMSALPGAAWDPDLLCRTDAPGGPPPVSHMHPNPAAFHLRPPDRLAVAATRVLLLDDTYVSGARAQSAAAALHLAGVRSVLVIPIGRVLRPDRIGAHADFLRRHTA